MFLSFVFASSLLLALGGATISVCPFNFADKYYIIHGIFLKDIGQALPGIPNNFTEAACSVPGLRVANLTADVVPDIMRIWQQCSDGMALSGLWFDYYEGLPI